MGSHSRFAPSATEREYLCPASFLLNANEPDRNSYDSANGTAAHHVGELCLKNDQDADLYAGCHIAVDPIGECRFVHEHAPVLDSEMLFEVDDEMVNGVQRYVDWCRETPGDMFVEIRVDHTDWCPQVPALDDWDEPILDANGDPVIEKQRGTADCIVCEPGVLTVTDLKYGKGVQVWAERNKQAIKYALGAWKEYNWIYDFRRVVIRIAQPRLDHMDVWETTVEELLAMGEDIRERLELTLLPDPPFGPSDKACKFCKVSARCKPLAAHLDSHRALAFDDETDFIDQTLLTMEDLEAAWRVRKLFEIRYKAIETEIVQCLKESDEGWGLKLVNAKTNRRWKDPVAARSELVALGAQRDKVEKRKLISPIQAEKLLGKAAYEAIGQLWTQPLGGPAIVDASDPRERFVETLAHADAFDDEDDDDGFDD